MAEYLDKAKIPWAKVDNPKGVFWERVVFESAIDSMPTADVIERTEFEEMVKSFKAMVEIKNENLIAMRDKYYTLEKEYAELKVNIKKAIEEIEQAKSVMNEEIIEYDRKDLINFINGINQCLIILKENIGE